MSSIINATTTAGVTVTGDNSGSLQLATNNGTTAVTIDTSQNVGIGLTPPVGSGNYRSLNVGATFIYGNTGLAVAAYNNNADINDKYIITGVASSYTQSSGNHIWYNAASGSAGASISFTERMRIDSTGNVGVGTTTPATPNNGGICFNPGSVASSIQVAGSSTSDANNGFLVYSTGSSSYKFYVGFGGTISAISTSISSLSDQSLKENIVDLPTGLTQVMLLKPRKFDWKDGEGTSEKNVDGFIAQELQEVMPNLVTQYQYNKTETKLGIKMGDLVPTLVKAIQELKAELDATKAEVQALKGVA